MNRVSNRYQIAPMALDQNVMVKVKNYQDIGPEGSIV